jgi:hypothetical protein
MAASAVTKTITQITEDQRNFTMRGVVAIGAGDYATPGLTFDLSSGDLPVSSAIPLEVRIYSVGAAIALYVYRYTPGTTNADGKLQIFTGAAAQSGLAELANGASPAGVTGDTINFVAVFQKFV